MAPQNTPGSLVAAHETRAISDNTRKAYAADWAHFSRWCRMNGLSPLPPSPDQLEHYLSDIASTSDLAQSSLERRLAGIAWNYRQRGYLIDRKSHTLAMTLTKNKVAHSRTPIIKEAITPQEMRAMVATLPFDLRGLRDRAMLLIGYIGGLRRGEIVGLDIDQDPTSDGTGSIEILDDRVLLTIQSKAGVRTLEIQRGDVDLTCPVHSLTQWLHYARIRSGPAFVRTSRDGKRALEARLNDRHIPRLIKSTVLKSGIRLDLPEKERIALFSGHSLRKGPISSVLTSSDTRFQVNLTKALGF